MAREKWSRKLVFASDRSWFVALFSGFIALALVLRAAYKAGTVQAYIARLLVARFNFSSGRRACTLRWS